MTIAEALRLREWNPDNRELETGYDPYNTADHIWWRWLLALSLGLLR